MSNNNGPLDWLKQLLVKKDGSETDKKKKQKLQFIFFLLILGIGFMVVSNLFNHKNQQVETTFKQTPTNVNNTVQDASAEPSSSTNQSFKQHETQYANELKEILQQMDGVGAVNVIVTLDNSGTKVYEKNDVIQNQTTTETDKNGGERTVEDLSKDEKIVTIKEGDKEVPIISESKKPAIRGVLVIAEGAKNIQTQGKIKEAVSRALGVSSYRVSVEPKKN